MSNNIYVNKINWELECEDCCIPIKKGDKYINDEFGGYVCLECAEDEAERNLFIIEKDIVDLEDALCDIQHLLEGIKKEMGTKQ